MLSAELGPSGGWLTDAAQDGGDPPGPRIVMLVADHDTQNALAAWARARGFDLSDDGARELAFHVTLLATANDVAIPLTDHLIEPVVAHMTDFAVLGRDNDVPVMLLAPDGLAEMREHFIATYGAEPTWPEFKPHVSLSYNWDGDPETDPRDTDPIDWPLVFDRLVVKPFDPNPPKSRGDPEMQGAKGILDWLRAFGRGSEDEDGQWQTPRQAIQDLLYEVSTGLDGEPSRADLQYWEESLSVFIDNPPLPEGLEHEFRVLYGRVLQAIERIDGKSRGDPDMANDTKGILDWLWPFGGSDPDRLTEAIETAVTEIMDTVRAVMEGGAGNRDVRGVRTQVNALFDQLQGLADAEQRLGERGKSEAAPPAAGDLPRLLADLERAG
jgi:hypothetical protein